MHAASLRTAGAEPKLKFVSAGEPGLRMDSDSFAQHVDRDLGTTLIPFSVTSDWTEDGNETSWNQFQQPDWQVRQQNE